MSSNIINSLRQRRLFFFKREIILMEERLVYYTKSPFRTTRFVLDFDNLYFHETFTLKGFYPNDTINVFGLFYFFLMLQGIALSAQPRPLPYILLFSIIFLIGYCLYTFKKVYAIHTNKRLMIEIWMNNPDNKTVKDFLNATRKYVRQTMINRYGQVESYVHPEVQATGFRWLLDRQYVSQGEYDKLMWKLKMEFGL